MPQETTPEALRQRVLTIAARIQPIGTDLEKLRTKADCDDAAQMLRDYAALLTLSQAPGQTTAVAQESLCSLDDSCQCSACLRERAMVEPDGILKLTRYGRAAFDAGRKEAQAPSLAQVEALRVNPLIATNYGEGFNAAIDRVLALYRGVSHVDTPR